MLSNIEKWDWKWGRGSSVHLLTFGHTIDKSRRSPTWGELDGSGRYSHSRKSLIKNLTSAVCFWNRISTNFGFDWFWQFLPFLVLCLSGCKWNTLLPRQPRNHHVYVSCSDPMFHDPHVASIRYEFCYELHKHCPCRAWVQRSRKLSDADCAFVWVRSVQQSAMVFAEHGEALWP